TWRVDCKSALRPGANTLRIRFRSPINEVLPVMAKLDYQLPASNDQGEKTSPYTRKAPYQYGWDWGPRFVTSGIWRAVTLEAWDGARLSDLHIKQDELTHDKAQLTAEVEVVATQETDATLSVERVAKDHATVARAQVKLHAGVNQIALPYALLNPQLWWPNGLGAQLLYTFRARLLVGGVQLDQTTTRVGLRSLELRQQPDEWGKSFEFVINGVPVFAKGGNWIPADSFPTRITRARYRQLIQ